MTSTPLDYAPWRATTLGATTERLERAAVLDLAGPLAGLDVLDVGCGDGGYTIAAARGGARAFGVDRSGAALVAARGRAGDARVAAEFIAGQADSLPLEAERFDVVIAVTVLCFVPDAQTAVREMARVLRPGGTVVLGELGRWSSWAAWRRVRAWAGDPTWRRARFRTRAELRALLRGAGLEPGPWRASAFYPPVGAVARLMVPLDAALGWRTELGAAFLGVAGRKRTEP